MNEIGPMLSLEAIVSGMGYAVLALLLGVLVSAGFLLPAGEPKELRQKLLRAGAYLVIVFLIIAVVSLLMQGAKLRPGTTAVLGTSHSLSHNVSFQESGKIWILRRGLRRGAGAYPILVRRRKTASAKAIRCVFLLLLPLVTSRSFTSHMPSL